MNVRYFLFILNLLNKLNLEMAEEFKKRDGDWKEGKIPQSRVMNWVWHARARVQLAAEIHDVWLVYGIN